MSVVERSAGEFAIHSRRIPSSDDEYADIFDILGYLSRAEDKQVMFV